MAEKYQGTYVGPHEKLKGHTAMIRHATHGYVVAQFNVPGLFHPNTGSPLHLGWTAFPEAHFKVEERKK